MFPIAVQYPVSDDSPSEVQVWVGSVPTPGSTYMDFAGELFKVSYISYEERIPGQVACVVILREFESTDINR